jgi:hypothetical protein
MPRGVTVFRARLHGLPFVFNAAYGLEPLTSNLFFGSSSTKVLCTKVQLTGGYENHTVNHGGKTCCPDVWAK